MLTEAGKENPARNLTPPTPSNPPATIASPAKNSGEEKAPQNTPQTPKHPPPPSRAAARPDPGLPFLKKDLQEFEAVALRIKQGEAGENVVAHSYKRNTRIGKANLYFQARENRNVVETVSLMELAVKLPRREAQIPGESSYLVDPYVAKLKQQHFLFMSCADTDVAFGAAYALIEAMQIQPDQRLLIDFASNPEKSNSTIQFFADMASEDGQKLTAIVIDGFHSQAQKFLDWLRATTTIGARHMREHLSDNNYFLLCLVDSKYNVTGNSAANPFVTWAVPCLQPLLKHHCPEQAEWLETEILNQQKLGKWKPTHAELCTEIRSALEDDLVQIVEQRRTAKTPEIPSLIPETDFKGDYSIEDTLLYVGTYFSDLAPHEFDQVVEWLLTDRTTTVTVKTQHHNADGTIQITETEVQKPLRDFWNNNPDKYLTSCQLEAVPDNNGTIAIRFAKETYRETLRTQLERRHSVYLLRQFKALQSHGFLTSTPTISDRAMSLSIKMATAYPTSFGKDWLLNIVVEARKNWAAAAGSNEGPLTSFSKHKALERISLFVRLMRGQSQLEEVVDGLFKDLMSLGMHDTVLFLVRGLQFSPGFDEFYWMKRLVDEGDEFLKLATYYHLYSYIRKIGIYPLLAKLKTWIPTDDRPLDSYPASCIYSLRLLVEYCAEVTETFESNQQTQHPLFTFVDEEAGRENCRQLVSWFFHPAMCTVFAGLDDVFTDDTPEARVMPFICELVLEWMLALRKQNGSAQSSTTNNERFLDMEQTRTVLIESLVDVATP
ncbi:MAG TPA: hypothetical protein VFX63_05165, partial [Pyrinomonadaceae bacterium]|nr:hypothetical protein [Pyrinomonadaceae bacterium]